MTEPATYTTILDDLWEVVSVLQVTPVNGLIEVTRQLEVMAPATGYLNGTLTPRRLRRDQRMLTALRGFQTMLKAIDGAAEEA